LKLISIFTLLLAFNSFLQARPADFEIGGINHLGLAVTDLTASQRFFTDTLGFNLVSTDDEYPCAFVANSENFVTLWQVSNPDTAIRFDRKNNVGLHHVAFAIDSFEALDSLYQTLLITPGGGNRVLT
jgi:lactoylglutathione lyase